MNNKTITFLSSRGRGMNADLSLLHGFLSDGTEWSEYSCRLFLKSERTKNAVVNAGIQKARKTFSESAVNSICIDNSLTGKSEEDEGVRILYSVPYDYQFKNYIAAKKKSCNFRTFQSFTHIVPGSPFSEELLRRAYDTEGKKIVAGTAHPLAWDVCQKASREKARKKLEFYFPAIKGKKILSIIMNGERKEQEKFFKDFSFDSFMEKLGPDWLVLSTSEEMRDCSFTYTGDKEAFGYIDHIVPASVLVYVADVLVTNEGRFAAAYAGRGKPVYCPRIKKNYFEKFMDAEYPELVLKKADQMTEIDFEREGLTEMQRRFCSQFWYADAEEPYSALQIIRENETLQKEG